MEGAVTGLGRYGSSERLGEGGVPAWEGVANRRSAVTLVFVKKDDVSVLYFFLSAHHFQPLLGTVMGKPRCCSWRFAFLPNLAVAFIFGKCFPVISVLLLRAKLSLRAETRCSESSTLPHKLQAS